MRLRYAFKACYTAAEILSRCRKAAEADPTGKSCIIFTPAKGYPNAARFWLPSVADAFRTDTKELKRQKINFSLARIYFCTDASLVFCTVNQRDKYASLNSIYMSTDECRRAGAEHWGESIWKEMAVCLKGKRLGLTTTNIWCPDNLGRRAEKFLDNYIVLETTLGKATARGILATYKCEIVEFCHPDVAKIAGMGRKFAQLWRTSTNRIRVTCGGLWILLESERMEHLDAGRSWRRRVLLDSDRYG